MAVCVRITSQSDSQTYRGIQCSRPLSFQENRIVSIDVSVRKARVLQVLAWDN